MRRIHDENPSYWPYGLDAEQFNGGLYMVQKAASDKPVGFVGWQKFDEDDRKVGYYAIGILPEHREQSFAKQAVTQVMKRIGNECDEVRAMVMAHNEPSKALARSVDVPMIEKLAMEKEALGPVGKAALSGLFGLGTGSAVDAVAYGNDGVIGKLRGKGEDFDSAALGDFALNALVGGGAPYLKSTVGRIATPVAAQATTIGFANAREGRRANAIARDQVEATREGGDSSFWKDIPKSVLYGAGGLGLGALALLAYRAKLDDKRKKEMIEEQGKGRVRITLPTKNPDDNETQVELPIDEMQFSNALNDRLRRDTKRRLNAETLRRTRHHGRERPPVEVMSVRGKSASAAESLSNLVDEIGFYKEAIGPTPAPQSQVPTPPQLGQNPAMRMNQQEQAVARSIQPAPDANPQIMKAEQQAMQAQQQAMQQAAQIEQQAQQAQMEQQQRFQEELMKAEQEKEVLKLELEKEKAMKELQEAQSKADNEAGQGEGTEAQKIIGNRLDRISQRLKSAADTELDPNPNPNPVPPGTPGTLDPETGKTVPKPPIHYKPYAADRYNSHPGAVARVPNIGVYRHSYGPILDSVYGLFRDRLLTPDPPARSSLGRSTMINAPDKLGMINQVLGGAPQAVRPGMLG